jgi:hypothetical protein
VRRGSLAARDAPRLRRCRSPGGHAQRAPQRGRRGAQRR